ncbi:hypothetical protein F2Q68_00036234 [Brassica cretica]|uniref:Uncharacterized protein n=1 Tax=Brassica cretica TaxID=69181 RepID=A0A8S9H6D0_BRACR|nr:hypothetical protein F2Q68_00036234 [Brassica cretica]
MEQATAGHIQNQNQRQPQSNRQAVPATGNSQPYELKGLDMMMQQLLQGQQVQAKVLNQVTTEMDTKMGNMFTDLNAKYNTLASHIRKIDVQLAQTAEKQPFAETVLGAEENTEQSASSGVTAPSEPAETPPVRVYVPKVPYPIPSKHLMDPISAEQLAWFRKMIKKVMDGDPHTDTKKLSGNAKANEKVQKKRVKGDPMMTLIPRLCDEKSIEYEVKCKGTSKPFSKVRAIFTHELKEKGEAALGKKGEIKKVMDGDPHTDTKKLSGNGKANEKVQNKRVKGDPIMTLIPRLCDEKSIEYEVKCKDAKLANKVLIAKKKSIEEGAERFRRDLSHNLSNHLVSVRKAYCLLIDSSIEEHIASSMSFPAAKSFGLPWLISAENIGKGISCTTAQLPAPNFQASPETAVSFHQFRESPNGKTSIHQKLSAKMLKSKRKNDPLPDRSKNASSTESTPKPT